MKKTKIVCTIGPASDSKEMLKQLMLAGMNVCRLNFSHGSHEEHQRRIDTIKEVRELLQLPVAIMLDTKGPEIRIGNFSNGSVDLKLNDRFTLTTRDVAGDNSIVSISYKEIADTVSIGSKILIDDGLVELEVVDIINQTDIITKANNYGTLKDKKGVNIPSAIINLPALTATDIEDIKFGIKNEVDFIAGSFVRKKEDVLQIRKVLEDFGGSNIDIIAKIESAEGVHNLSEIISAADGIMVARGDLGVEIKTEIVPLVQKEIIRKTNIEGKPVITATQMLDSMIRNPRPTRAEVNDVANAILDGTDAVMLSGETAAGKYPLESVVTMKNIAINTEQSSEFEHSIFLRRNWRDATTTNAISRSTCSIADQLSAAAIITSTSSGATSKAISKFRPKATIVAATYDPAIARKLSLVWGLNPVIAQISSVTDDVIEGSINAALKNNYVSTGDLVVLTAGIPVGYKGTTNLIKVHTIANVMTSGMGIGKASLTGTAVIDNGDGEDLVNKVGEDSILVTKSTDATMIEAIQKCKAIIVEVGGLTSHAAIVALNLGKPAIIGAKNATQSVKDGMSITLDTITGLVYEGQAKVL